MSVFVNPLKSNKAKFKEKIVLQIYHHKKAAEHLQAAAQNHREASKHYEDGNKDLALISSMKANSEMALVKTTFGI